jgi:thiamine-monophosphate kinase
VTSESDFIASLRALATSEAARNLLDDAAVLNVDSGTLVVTHDMIAEGVHYRADDPPGDVAWKLVAVNLSDLAGKGARPFGVLLGFTVAVELGLTVLLGFGVVLGLAEGVPVGVGDGVATGAAA